MRQHLYLDTKASGARGLTARPWRHSPQGEGTQKSHFMAQVLQQTMSPEGPQLHLSPTFASRENQDKLEQFIRQFICS